VQLADGALGGRLTQFDVTRRASNPVPVQVAGVLAPLEEHPIIVRAGQALDDRLVSMPRWLAELPVLARFVVMGGLVGGVMGCVAGLVIGLLAYAPTAWFAVFEVGIPGAVAGCVVGLVVGLVNASVRKARIARSMS
jgi:membrane associated rhomboid family serine protease